MVAYFIELLIPIILAMWYSLLKMIWNLLSDVVYFLRRGSARQPRYFYQAGLLSLLIPLFVIFGLVVFVHTTYSELLFYGAFLILVFLVPFYPVLVFITDRLLFNYLEKKDEPTPLMRTHLELALREMRMGNYARAHHYLRLVDHHRARELEDLINQTVPDEPDFLSKVKGRRLC